MKNDCPCYGCNDRTIACHSTCKRHAAWKEQHEADKAKRDKAKEEHIRMRGYYVDLAKAIKKGEHR